MPTMKRTPATIAPGAHEHVAQRPRRAAQPRAASRVQNVEPEEHGAERRADGLQDAPRVLLAPEVDARARDEERHRGRDGDQARDPDGSGQRLHVEVRAGPASGRSSGKRMTSRIDAAFVSTMTSRSIPMPKPAAGGIPCSSARM